MAGMALALLEKNYEKHVYGFVLKFMSFTLCNGA